MKKYSLNEDEIIDFVFEKNNNLYSIDKRLFNKKETINELNINSQGLDNLKKKAKLIGKGLASIPLMMRYCYLISKSLNRNWQVKKIAFPIIKEVFKESMYCLNFFLKSNYSSFLILPLKTFYSWELTMACIILYESFRDEKSISETLARVKSVTPEDVRSNINDYYNKIKGGAIYLSTLNKIQESGYSGSPSKPGSSSSSSSTGITSSDLNKIYDFLFKSSAIGNAKITRDFSGSYMDFMTLFASAKSISGLTSPAVNALNKIYLTLRSGRSEFKDIDRFTSEIEKGIRNSRIWFPSNEMTSTSGAKKINYDTTSRSYTIDKGFNFVDIQDTGNFSISSELLRLKFMFLFASKIDESEEKNQIINHIVSQTKFLNNK